MQEIAPCALICVAMGRLVFLYSRTHTKEAELEREAVPLKATLCQMSTTNLLLSSAYVTVTWKAIFSGANDGTFQTSDWLQLSLGRIKH